MLILIYGINQGIKDYNFSLSPNIKLSLNNLKMFACQNVILKNNLFLFLLTFGGSFFLTKVVNSFELVAVGISLSRLKVGIKSL